MHVSRFALASLLVAAAVACAGDARDAATGATITDSAGVRLIDNGATGAWGDQPLRLTETRRIGVVDGDETLQFHQIYSLAVAGDGTIFVGNNQTATVRVFSPAGEFVRELGGKGRGPGEYSMVNRVWLAGDGVAITDWQGGGKTGVYARDGRLVHFWQASRADRSMVTPFASTPDGGWLARYEPPYERSTLAPGTRTARLRFLYRFDAARNEVTDSILPIPTRTLYGSPQTEGLDWALFDPTITVAADAAGRVYTTPTEDYRIEVYDGTGRHVQRISRAYDPVPIRDDDIARLKSMVAARYDARPANAHDDPRRERDRIVARIDRQRAFNPRRQMPPLGALLVAPDGSFWVERADNADPATLEYDRMFGMFARQAPRPSRWDLFDASGTFLGSADVDPRFTPMAVRGAEVTGVYKDELDVEYVVTYRASP